VASAGKPISFICGVQVHDRQETPTWRGQDGHVADRFPSQVGECRYITCFSGWGIVRKIEVHDPSDCTHIFGLDIGGRHWPPGHDGIRALPPQQLLDLCRHGLCDMQGPEEPVGPISPSIPDDPRNRPRSWGLCCRLWRPQLWCVRPRRMSACGRRHAIGHPVDGPAIPFSPLGTAVGLVPLPLSYFPGLVATLLSSCVLT
jgi:hypothetical protein